MINILVSTKQSLTEVLGWLERGQTESGEGFFCNESTIVTSHDAGELFCGLADNRVVGFVVHNKKSVGASIDILEVHPQHRSRGFGSQLATNAIGRLFATGAAFVTVQCSPRSSEPFWRSLGFLPQDSYPSRAGEPTHLVLHNVA